MLSLTVKETKYNSKARLVMQMRRRTIFAFLASIGTIWSLLDNKKTSFVYQTKGVFLNDVFRCAERDGVMRPSDVMCASRVKVTLAEHITSLLPRQKTSLWRSHNITCPSGQTSHHSSETGSGRKPRAFLRETG